MHGDIFWAFVLVCSAGASLGAMAAIVWSRRKAPAPNAETSKHEAPRFSLLNETGNVLISTSLSTANQLPDDTLKLFSEALAHLATVFYAVAGAKDSDTGEPFSLYNYKPLKRVLDGHPFFIRLSTEEPKSATTNILKSRSFLSRWKLKSRWFRSGLVSSPMSVRASPPLPPSLEERVKLSCAALGMHDSPQNLQKLRDIHINMEAEAKRLAASAPLKAKQSTVESEAPAPLDLREQRPTRLGAAPKKEKVKERAVASATRTLSDSEQVEVGYIMLNCECLMGVSLVSVKLEHQRYKIFLESKSMGPMGPMEQDTYLFVSPSQLKKVSGDINNLPRVNIGA